MDCGCEQRKEVMFIEGRPDLVVAMLIGVPLALLIYLKWVK